MEVRQQPLLGEDPPRRGSGSRVLFWCVALLILLVPVGLYCAYAFRSLDKGGATNDDSANGPFHSPFVAAELTSSRDLGVTHTAPLAPFEQLEAQGRSDEGRWFFGDRPPIPKEIEELQEGAHGNGSRKESLRLLGPGVEAAVTRQNLPEEKPRDEHRNFSDLTAKKAEELAEQQATLDAQCPGFEGGADTQSSCLGAPYLYLTFHGGKGKHRVKTVCKFTRNGCSLGSAIVPSSAYTPRNLRGLLLYRNFLFVAEAHRLSSKILRYSHCNPTHSHRRELLDVVVNGSLPDSATQPDEGLEFAPAEEGLSHPYGFAMRQTEEGDPHLYVSVQNTFIVQRYDAISGHPGDIAPALLDAQLKGQKEKDVVESFEPTESDLKRQRAGQPPLRKYRLTPEGLKFHLIYNGTFADLGNDEVRGIAFDHQGILYIADKQKGVLAFDAHGLCLGALPGVKEPISLAFCKERATLWVGSTFDHQLHEFDVSTWEKLQSIGLKGELKHPAGFAIHGDYLYVISQKTGKLLEFSVQTGKLSRVVLSDMGRDAGERVLLSPC